MKSENRTRKTPRYSRQRLIGTSSTVLLIGFWAGLTVGHSLSAATLAVASTVTVAAFVSSAIATKLTGMFQQRAERKACDQAILELERRMERLIPKRRVFAHGKHENGKSSLSPHAMEESESDWMPVSRRSRSRNLR